MGVVFSSFDIEAFAVLRDERALFRRGPPAAWLRGEPSNKFVPKGSGGGCRQGEGATEGKV